MQDNQILKDKISIYLEKHENGLKSEHSKKLRSPEVEFAIMELSRKNVQLRVIKDFLESEMGIKVSIPAISRKIKKIKNSEGYKL